MQKVENWTRLGHIYADCSVLAGNMMLMTFDKNKKSVDSISAWLWQTLQFKNNLFELKLYL